MTTYIVQDRDSWELVLLSFDDLQENDPQALPQMTESQGVRGSET